MNQGMLQLANAMFRRGEFDEAYLLYQKLTEKNAYYKKIVDFNMELCRRRRQVFQCANGSTSAKSHRDPKVSVIVPIFNVEPYIEKCLDSIVSQSLDGLEIICVNDGSTDSSIDVVERYSRTYSNLLAVHKPNAGYGSAVNLGLKIAKGEYVGIVEPDDFVTSNMFEELYKLAKENDADIARGTAIAFAGNTPNDKLYGQPPSDCLENTFRLTEYPDFLVIPPAIWSAIYKRSFISENKILAPETPGASFQDVGFFVLASYHAKKISCTWRPFYYYRNDNPNASRFSKGKVNVIFDLFSWLDERLDLTNESVAKAYIRRKLNDFRWSFNRVADEYKSQYLMNALVQLKDLERSGYDLKQIGPRYADFIETVFNREPNKGGHENADAKDGTPFLSVIVPVYNARDYLPEFLDNIFEQTFLDFELILVDDKSTDGSLELLMQYAGRDDRVRVIPLPENCGASTARNEGLAAARGVYVRFLDADDMLPRDSFQVLCEAARQYRSDVVKGNLYGYDFKSKKAFANHWGGRRYDEEQTIRNGDLSTLRVLWGMYDHQAFLVRRSIFTNANIKYPVLKNFQDPPVIAEILVNAATVSVVPNCVYYLVCNRNIQTITRRKWQYENFVALLKGYDLMLDALESKGYLQVCKYKMNTFARDWVEKIKSLHGWGHQESLYDIYDRMDGLQKRYKYELWQDGDPPYVQIFFFLLSKRLFTEAQEFLSNVVGEDVEQSSEPSLVFYPPWNQRNPYIDCVYRKTRFKTIAGTIYSALGLLCSGRMPEVVFHLHWTDLVIQKTARSREEANANLYIFIYLLEEFKRLGGKFVWTMHNYQPHENTYPLQEKILTKSICERADQVIVHSESGRKFLEKSVGFVGGGKVRVAPHGNYIDCYENRCDSIVARKQLNLDDERKHFLFVGQVRQYKGIDNLLDAFGRVQEKYPNASLTIAGSVPDGQYKSDMVRKLRDIRNVVLVPEYIRDNELQVYLNSADFVVLPYKSILTSGSAMLAFSFSRPVIVPNLEGLADIVRHRYNGIVYETDIYDGIVEAMEMDSDSLLVLQENAYQTAVNYDWGVMHSTINSI